jgi:hypothetical protein
MASSLGRRRWVTGTQPGYFWIVTRCPSCGRCPPQERSGIGSKPGSMLGYEGSALPVVGECPFGLFRKLGVGVACVGDSLVHGV